MRFFVTFGQRHPLRDHWVVIDAIDHDEARTLAFEVLGNKWAFLYDEKAFDKEFFPAGPVGRIIR
jgi:hypothetical protein